jgi:Reverse transcriptase (RNA-dependent DNA polymerase)
VEQNINLPPVPEFADVTFNTEPITAEKMKNALKGYKSGKACGKDGIPSEVLQLEVGQMFLLTCCNKCLSTGSAPDQWLKQSIIAVPKKGDLTQCTNYRGIALMFYRLQNRLATKLRYNQNCFRPYRSTLQNVLAFRRLFEVAKIKKNYRFVCTFIDFCKAFDSAKWNYVKAISITYNLLILLVNEKMALYNRESAEVVTSDGNF